MQKEYRLKKGCVYKIGRDSQNDIVITNLMASRFHAVIEYTGNNPVITDKESTYGTFVNGSRVEKQILKNGDLLQIGIQNFKLEKLEDDFKLAIDNTYSNSSPVVPNKNGEFIIGRDKSCSVRVEQPTLFLEHAKISKKNNEEFYIEPLHGNSSVVVNGIKEKSVSIKEGDVLNVGSNRLTIINGTLLSLGKTDGFRVDVLNVNKNFNNVSVLKDISFSIKSGEFVGFLGPSGSGKTTLIKIIAGAILQDSGNVYFDGFLNKNGFFNSQIGVVPQDDILHDNLTPKESISFACRMRLSGDASNEEIDEQTKKILTILEIENISNSQINSLSGGQKKRVSVGIELAAQPALLMLDEPTSNLDPGLEYKTMRLLRKVADKKRTVVLSTHNLSQINMLDKIGVIHEGRLIYFGPPSDLNAYFAVTSTDEIFKEFKEGAGKHLEEKFRQSTAYHEYVKNALDNREDFGAITKNKNIGFTKSHSSAFSQLFLQVGRYFKTNVRDPLSILILFFQAPLIAILTFLVFGTTSGSWSMLFTLSLSCIWLGSINSVKEICKERKLVFREQRLGMNTFSYFLSKVLPLSLLAFIQIIVLTLTVNSLAQFEGDIYLHLINFFSISFAATAMGLFISSVSLTTDRALLILPLVLIPQILFSGAVMPFDEMFGVSRIISLVTISRWGFAASKKISMGIECPCYEWVILYIISLSFIFLSVLKLGYGKKQE